MTAVHRTCIRVQMIFSYYLHSLIVYRETWAQSLELLIGPLYYVYFFPLIIKSYTNLLILLQTKFHFGLKQILKEPIRISKGGNDMKTNTQQNRRWGSMKDLVSTKNGAEHLRKSIAKAVSSEDASLLKSLESSCRLVLRHGLSSPIHLEKNGEHILLSKGQNTEADSDQDFTLLLRLIPSAKSIEWWPIEWSSREGEKICAEINIDGRLMTNLHVQNELIEIANTWGKSISAQRVSRELDGTL